MPAPPSPLSKPKAADTAVLEAIAAEPEPEQEEFEMEFDDGDPEPEVEGIPLADEETVTKPAKAKPQSAAAQAANAPTAQHVAAAKPGEPGKEDDAIAQFLLDLKLDDEE